MISAEPGRETLELKKEGHLSGRAGGRGRFCRSLGLIVITSLRPASCILHRASVRPGRVDDTWRE